MTLSTGSSLNRSPVGEPREGSFTGILREKEYVYLGSFSGTQRTLKFKSGCHLELKQGTGLP